MLTTGFLVIVKRDIWSTFPGSILLRSDHNFVEVLWWDKRFFIWVASHGSWSLTFQFPIIRSYRVLMYYPGGIDYKEWSRITSNLVVRVTLVLSPPSSVDQP